MRSTSSTGNGFDADARDEHGIEKIVAAVALIDENRAAFFGRNENEVATGDFDAWSVGDVQDERLKWYGEDQFTEFFGGHGGHILTLRRKRLNCRGAETQRIRSGAMTTINFRVAVFAFSLRLCASAVQSALDAEAHPESAGFGGLRLRLNPPYGFRWR